MTIRSAWRCTLKAWLALAACALALAAYAADADPTQAAAEAALRGGRYAEAEPLFQQALALREAALGGEHADVAQSLAGLAAVYQMTGRFPEAEANNRRALAIRERQLGPDHADTATSWRNLGETLRLAGRNAEAEVALRRSLEIREKRFGAQSAEVADSLRKLGDIYRLSGRLAEAETTLLRSIAILEHAGPDPRALAYASQDLSLVYLMTGRYAAAKPALQRTRSLLQPLEGTDHAMAHCLTFLAWVDLLTGRHADAAAGLRRSIALLEKVVGPDHPDVAVNLASLGRAELALGHRRDAAELQRRAASIYERRFGPTDSRLAVAQVDLGTVLRATGQAAEAGPLQDRALATLEKSLGAEHPAMAYHLAERAETFLALGRGDDAGRLLQRALGIALQHPLPDTLWRVQWSLAGAMATRSPELAIFWGKQAVNTLQSIRSDLSELAADMQSSFLVDKRDVYAVTAQRLVARGRLAEAEQVLALLKEQEAFDLLRRSVAARPLAELRGAEVDAARLQERLSEEGLARTRELGTLSATPAAQRSPEHVARLQRLRAESADWWRRHEAWLQSLPDRFRASGQDIAPADSATQLQQLVRGDPGAVGLHYVLGDDRLTVIVSTPQGSVGRTWPLDRRVLAAQIDALRGAVQNLQADPRAPAQALYRSLLAPLEAELQAAQARTLVLSLTDSLRYLPFAALHDGRGWLVERFAIGQVVLGAPLSGPEGSARPWRVAGLGTTRAIDPFVALPGVRQELQAIVRREDAAEGTGLLPGTIALDEEFGRSRLADALRGDYPVVHVGSHFVFQPGDESASFLLLGDGQRFTLGEFAALDYRGVQMLTLSACDTASGGGHDQRGVEVEGLATIVVQRGAQSVLATLWPVADPSTLLLMRSFYAQRVGASPTGRAAALRQAQLRLLGQGESGPRAQRFAHPFYWAPFVLMGAWL